jgi:hypothetical protein
MSAVNKTAIKTTTACVVLCSSKHPTRTSSTYATARLNQRFVAPALLLKTFEPTKLPCAPRPRSRAAPQRHVVCSSIRWEMRETRARPTARSKSHGKRRLGSVSGLQMVANRTESGDRESDNGPVHRRETPTVPASCFGQQRLQPLHARQARQGRRLKRSPASC